MVNRSGWREPFLDKFYLLERYINVVFHFISLCIILNFLPLSESLPKELGPKVHLTCLRKNLHLVKAILRLIVRT